jgi:hypothetical protein
LVLSSYRFDSRMLLVVVPLLLAVTRRCSRPARGVEPTVALRYE